MCLWRWYLACFQIHLYLNFCSKLNKWTSLILDTIANMNRSFIFFIMNFWWCWCLIFSSKTDNCRITEVPSSVYIISGHTLSNNVRKGQKIKFGCKYAAKFLYGTSEVECLANGQWSQSFPTCGGNSILLSCGEFMVLNTWFYSLVQSRNYSKGSCHFPSQILVFVANRQVLTMATSRELFVLSTNTVNRWSIPVSTSIRWQDLLIKPAAMVNGSEMIWDVSVSDRKLKYVNTLIDVLCW